MHAVRRYPAALVLAFLVGGGASSEVDRSARITQVTRSTTMAERSSAAFDQISTVEAGRSSVTQIDPGLALKDDKAGPESLSAGQGPAPPSACELTPEQQSIVTSLEAQGRLPAGDCEMVAWFAEPRDKSEAEDRQSLAESVVAGAPELVGQDVEADRLAREAEDLARAEAAATAAAISLFSPTPGQ
jgi:hypothetical protein